MHHLQGLKINGGAGYQGPTKIELWKGTGLLKLSVCNISRCHDCTTTISFSRLTVTPSKTRTRMTDKEMCVLLFNIEFFYLGLVG